MIEDGCLWVPTLMHGRRWPNARALRPNEFAITLAAAIEQAHCHNRHEASSMPIDFLLTPLSSTAAIDGQLGAPGESGFDIPKV